MTTQARTRTSRLLKVNSVLHIDETGTSIRIKIAGDGTKLGRYKKKYIWCVVNEAEKVTYFFYDNDENDSRGLRPIQEFLAGFEKGTILSDAYTVYELLTNGNKKLERVLCWAHVRNRFESAFLSAKDKIADWFVKKIAELSERLLYTDRMPYPSEVRMGLEKRVCSSHCVRHASNMV